MSKTKMHRAARLMPFAHFLGLASAEEPKEPDDTGVAAEDDERKQRDGESDDDYARRMEELDEKEQSQRAEGEDDDPKADDVDGDDADAEDEKEDKETAKRAGRAQGARARERQRCAAILAQGIKLGRVNTACSFAFDSDLTVEQAVAALRAAELDNKSSRRPALSDRMATVRAPNPGADGGTPANVDPTKSLASKIVAMGERARSR
jgi:hypothetical protein